jgi:hypothetical protein
VSTEAPEESVEHTSEAIANQGLMNSLYAMDNVLTIDIQMTAAQWEALKTEQPVGGVCNFDVAGGTDRFSPHATTSVTVSGTKFPSVPRTFTGVEIKKKSFCGSFVEDPAGKPSIKLKFGTEAEALLGTRHLTLNNSVQDLAFIRQPLGYKILGMGGLPHSRCNFAKVSVNGSLVQNNGIYVDVEPIRAAYLANPDNPFVNRTSGNLYEFEYDDFSRSRLPFMEAETPESRSIDMADFKVAADQIATGVGGMEKVVDVEQFIKLFAMEFLLKHHGYTRNGNNTYVYNDVPDVGLGQKFKFIPSGIDQIFGSEVGVRTFDISANRLLGNLVRNDPAKLALLRAQIKTYNQTIFDHATYAAVLKPFIDQMESILIGLGLTGISPEIERVRRELKLVRSAAFQFADWPTTTAPVYVLDDSGRAIHASNTEPLVTGGTDFEVLHRAYQDSGADRWFLSPGAPGYSRIRNESYNRWLHCSNTQRTPAGHLRVYTTPNEDTLGSKDFLFTLVTPAGFTGWEFTGYFRVSNRRNGQFLRFGTDDLTPASQRPRVYQTGLSSASKVALF